MRWGVAQATAQGRILSQWELNLGERWSGSLTVCTWYCPSYLSDVPSHTVTLSTSPDTLRDPSQHLESVKCRSIFNRLLLFGPKCLLTGLNIWAWCCGARVFPISFPLSRNSPATAPGGRKRLLTRHVSRAGCDTRAQRVPGPGERWSSAPHQGAHPRWWVTQDSVWWSRDEFIIMDRMENHSKLLKLHLFF